MSDTVLGDENAVNKIIACLMGVHVLYLYLYQELIKCVKQSRSFSDHRMGRLGNI